MEGKAWLLTWTTYGTWLPGDERGFVGFIQDARPMMREPTTPVVGSDFIKKRGPGPAPMAATHLLEGAARGTGQAVQGSRGPVPGGDHPRHVADGIRCTVPSHHVRGQADAWPRPDAGHRAGEPGVQGQARRPSGGLPGPGRVGRRTLSRRSRSPRCWKTPSSTIRTRPSRQPR